MKIIEYIPQLGIGGAERFCLDISNELANNNEVILCVSHPVSDTFHYLQELSSRVKLVCFGKTKGFDWKLPFRVLRMIKKENADVVHTHLMSIVYTSLAALIFRKAKYFHTVHNSARQESDGKIGSIVRKFMFGNGLIQPITISNDSEKSFEEFYGYPAKVIFNGRNLPAKIEPSKEVVELYSGLRVSPNVKIIVQLAHVGYQKRQIVMAEAVDRLNKEGHNIVVLMIGTIDEQSMADKIRALSNPNIMMLGAKNNPLDYLKLADGFGLCSEFEGLPISLIEALGMGAVPVCTPVGGIVDLITDGVNGFLSKSISQGDYYSALKRFVELDNTELEKMKNNAQESYKPYSMTACAASYLKLFKNQVGQ